jgi:hypothetical protein
MQAIMGTDDARGITMRKADAIELLDVRAFITTRSFGGELYHIYKRGDREELECEALEAEIQGATLTFRVTGKHRSDPKGQLWTHDYTYSGHFLVHWTDA